jgi:acetylornithine deacetylase/succinyl-diaminopimelate desuccinylase-like protein
VDGRWYGRGAADCKGNILVHLTALRALGDDLPVHLKLVVEGSEEQGTGGLEAFVPEHADLLRGDRRPGVRRDAEAMRTAYDRPMGRLGQGGSIPLCTVLAETYPDAEILLIGVEEPQALIHAPNESVAPQEIAAMALTEALFLREYGAPPADGESPDGEMRSDPDRRPASQQCNNFPGGVISPEPRQLAVPARSVCASYQRQRASLDSC